MSFLKDSDSDNIYNSSREEVQLEINAIVNIEDNNFQDSIRILKNAINKFNKNPYFHYLIAFSYEQQQAYKAAINSYKNYIDIAGHYYNAYFRIGLCYQQLENFQDSLSFYDKSIESFEKFTTIAEELIEKNYDDEIINGNYYNIPKEKILANRANVKMSLGDWPSAVEDCKKAIEINPKYPNPYFLLGVYNYQNKNHKDAKNLFEKSANLGFTKAETFLRQLYGDDDSNKNFYEEVEEYAESPDAKQKTGGVQMRVGFKNDISSTLSDFDEIDINLCENLAVEYMKNMWSQFNKVAGSIDDFNKALIAYEISKAFESIIPEINQDSFWKRTFETAIEK